MFEIKITNGDGSQEWNVPYLSWSFGEALNNDRSASLLFSYQHAEQVASASGGTPLDIFAAAYRVVEILDGDEILYRGYLRAPQRSRGVSESGNISVGSKGIFQLLDRRLTPSFQFFNNEDLSDIAWDLISTTQAKANGDLGITRGVNPITRDAQRTYAYDYVGEAVDKLSNKERADGIDFELDVLDRFNVYYPFKGDDNGVTFTDGINIETFSVKRKSVDELTNYAVVQSTESYGEDSLIATSTGVNSSLFGLLEKYSSDDAKQLATVQEKADRIIENEDLPFVEIDLTVNLNAGGVTWSSFGVGDFVTIVIPEEQINGLFRVYERSLNHENIMSITVKEDSYVSS